MELNTKAYAGEHTLNSFVKYTDTIQQNVINNNLKINKPLDESCFLNYCIKDTLASVRSIRFNIVNGNVEFGDFATIRPEINNYMLLYNPGGTDFSAGMATDAYNILASGRMGSYPNQKMGSDLKYTNKTPAVAVCYDVATSYCVLGIKAVMATYTTNTDPLYDTIYAFSSITERNVKDVLNEPDTYWDNHACLCMYATTYIGDENTRTWYRGVGVGSSFGNEAFSIPNIDSNTYLYNEMDTDKVLNWGGHLLASRKCLGQGIEGEIEINASNYGEGKNVVILMPNCNSTFFSIVVSGRPSASRTRIRTAILDKLRFMSAFNAYNCTGLIYFDNETDARTGDPLSNENARQGKKEKDGRTSPLALADTVGAGLSTDGSSMYSVTGFNGNENADDNNYVDKTDLSRPTLSPIDVFNRTFAMTAIQIRALADFLWNADDDKMTEIIEGLKLYGENPLNGLIDCRLYPFDLSGISEAGQQIIVGRVNTEVYGRKILNTANVVFDLGKCKFMKYFNNFLDYAPYTTGRLFLPYCGLVPIDTAEFMGKEISCKLIVDLITGACCCCIFLDDILTITANGICGTEISMTGTDSASYANAVVSSFANGIVGIVGAGASVAGGASLGGMMANQPITNPSTMAYDVKSNAIKGELATGAGIGGGVKGVLSSAQSFWEAQTTPVQYAQRGSSTPSCETWLPQYPYFIIDSPITDIPSGYGHNVGFACIKTGQLSSFSGFTICSNVDTSGFAQATQEERAELKTLLEAGVFL